MRSVYADNYKGFKNQVVNLSPVSFFVGQNSTGKSSLMSLMHILFSQDFWLNMNFNSKDHPSGLFSDLVSKESDDRSLFTVGSFLVRDSVDGGDKSYFCAVVTFEEVDDIPEVKRCTIALGDKSLTYEFIENGLVRFSIDEMDQSLHHGFFEALILRHKSDLKGDVFPLKLSQGMHKSRSLMRVVFEVFTGSANGLFEHASILDDSAWFDPIRAKPSRFYQVSGRHEFSACGGHTPYLLKEILGKRGSTKRDKSISHMIRLIGAESGLFEDVKISTQGGGKSSPFSVQVTINGIDHYVDQVGYGVSQVLPMIVELLNHGSFDSYYLQQPEVHLHPKAQAGFSNLIYIYATRFPDTLLAIETHSDYVLDRFSVLCREKYFDLKNVPVSSIYWHEKSGDGVNRVHKIDLDSNGDLPVELPDGYREFFIKESMRSIGLNVDN